MDVDDRIREGLAALGDAIEPTERPDAVVDRLRRPRVERPRRWPLLVVSAAAAGIVVVAALGLVAATRDPLVVTGPPATSTATTPTAPAPGPDAAWLPTWVPEGLEPWDMQVADAHVDAREVPAFPTRTQLLRSGTGEGAMLLTVRPHAAGMDGGAPIEIRGTTGHIIEENLPIQRRALLWTELGVDIEVALRDVTDGEAVAHLNELVLRHPNDARAGFAPPSGAWALVGDHVAIADPSALHRATVALEYRRARPDGATPADLSVTTMAGGVHAPGYLRAVFDGALTGDGVAVERRMPCASRCRIG